jgi:hypothetical protein
MRPLVIDTGVYIDWLSTRRHEDILFDRGALKYFSAVVLMELRAGTFSVPDRRLIQQWEATFHRLRTDSRSHARNLCPGGRRFTPAPERTRLQHQAQSFNRQ